MQDKPENPQTNQPTGQAVYSAPRITTQTTVELTSELGPARAFTPRSFEEEFGA